MQLAAERARAERLEAAVQDGARRLVRMESYVEELEGTLGLASTEILW